MSELLVIEINGLPDGSRNFHWDLGKEFFALFGNPDISDAGVGADAKLVKSGDFIGVDITLTGSVTVPCDRCLAPLQIPVDETILLSVKFGAEGAGAGNRDESDGEREVVYLPEEEAVVDLNQIVYDYVCLAIPVKRVHPEGHCDESVAKYIGKQAVPAVGDTPFAGLKDLLGGK